MGPGCTSSLRPYAISVEFSLGDCSHSCYPQRQHIVLPFRVSLALTHLPGALPLSLAVPIPRCPPSSGQSWAWQIGSRIPGPQTPSLRGWALGHSEDLPSPLTWHCALGSLPVPHRSGDPIPDFTILAEHSSQHLNSARVQAGPWEGLLQT